MKVLVCGSRDFSDRYAVTIKLCTLFAEGYDTLIEGEARGADLIAKQAGESLGMRILSFPADWNKYGKQAGYTRNQQMLDEGQPDLVVAFYAQPVKSRGTQMMVNIAKQHNTRVEEHVPNE